MAKHYRNNRSSSNRSREKSGASKSIVWVVVGIVVGVGAATLLYSKFQTSGTGVVEQAHHALPVRADTSAKTTLPVVAAAPAPAVHKPKFDFYTMLATEQAQLNQEAPAAAAPKPTDVSEKQPAPAAASTASLRESLAPPASAAPQNSESSVSEQVDTAKPISDSAAVVKKANKPPVLHEDSLAQEAQEALNSVKKSSKNSADNVSTGDHNDVTLPSHYFLQVAAVADESQADRLKAQLLLMGLNVTVQKGLENGQTINHVNLGPYASRKLALKQQALLERHKVSSILIKN